MPNVYIERTIESREVSTLDITQTRNGFLKNIDPLEKVILLDVFRKDETNEQCLILECTAFYFQKYGSFYRSRWFERTQ